VKIAEIKPPTNVIKKFKINVYIYTLDKIIGTLDQRSPTDGPLENLSGPQKNLNVRYLQNLFVVNNVIMWIVDPLQQTMKITSQI
jgi:hypothetical protein